MNVILVKKSLCILALRVHCVWKRHEKLTDNSRLCAENAQQSGFQLTFQDNSRTNRRVQT